LKKVKIRPVSDLPPLPPEAAEALKLQVEAAAAACETGGDPESLKNLVNANPADLSWDLHLLAALGHVNHPAIPLLLAALFGSAPDKSRRKALKRALHLLKTRGVPVPAELLPREEPRLGQVRTAAVKALVTPILGNGDSYVILIGPKEILGGNFLVALLNDVTGLLETHLLNLKGSREKELWEHYRQHGLEEWFPVPGPYAVRLLEAAHARETAKAPAKSTYAGLREKIWRAWGRPDEAQDPEQALPPPDPAERSRLLEQSRQLAAHPLFHTWLPALEEITPWLEKLQEVQQSPLVLSEPQKLQRFEALYDEATQALFPPDSRPLWRRRLLAMAYYLSLSSRSEEARIAQAAAADLGETARGPLAGENLFLKTLVQLSLQMAWQMSQEPQETQGDAGLLTLPGRSGLIRS
jgi:hypothetical protein